MNSKITSYVQISNIEYRGSFITPPILDDTSKKEKYFIGLHHLGVFPHLDFGVCVIPILRVELKNTSKCHGFVWLLYSEFERFWNNWVENNYCSLELERLFSFDSIVISYNNFWGIVNQRGSPHPK